jgi:hypothetical protein
MQQQRVAKKRKKPKKLEIDPREKGRKERKERILCFDALNFLQPLFHSPPLPPPPAAFLATFPPSTASSPSWYSRTCATSEA